MSQDRWRFTRSGASLLLCAALIAGIVQCSRAQAIEVTYYYLPG